MFLSNSPSFSPQWFQLRADSRPTWLSDDRWIPPGEQMLYSNAKSGLYAVLDQFDGGIALLPEYLPPGVVNVFAQIGFEVEYYPVNYDFSLPTDVVLERLTELTPTVAMFVHYFGFADREFPMLAQVAREVDSFVIEDAARGLFARDEREVLLGATGDAAVFSLHKCLPAPNGGLVVAPGMSLPEPTTVRQEWPQVFKRVAARGMKQLGWTPYRRPIAQPQELIDHGRSLHVLESGVWPPSNPGSISRLALLRSDPSTIRAARQTRYAALREQLAAIDCIEVTSPKPYTGACPYGVVVHVPAGPEVSTRTFTALRRQGLPVERFLWPIEISQKELSAYPDAGALRDSTIVIPAHPQLPLQYVTSVVETIEAQSAI